MDCMIAWIIAIGIGIGVMIVGVLFFLGLQFLTDKIVDTIDKKENEKKSHENEKE